MGSNVVRLPELEVQVRQLKEQLETEKLKAANAEGKFELVQKSLKASEERAATLELQIKSRATASTDARTDLTSAQRDAEVLLVQNVCLRTLGPANPVCFGTL